jgi:hypothetical protein
MLVMMMCGWMTAQSENWFEVGEKMITAEQARKISDDSGIPQDRLSHNCDKQSLEKYMEELSKKIEKQAVYGRGMVIYDDFMFSEPGKNLNIQHGVNLGFLRNDVYIELRKIGFHVSDHESNVDTGIGETQEVDGFCIEWF